MGDDDAGADREGAHTQNESQARPTKEMEEGEDVSCGP